MTPRPQSKSHNVVAESQHPRSSLSEEQMAFLIESGAFTLEGLRETQANIARGELAEEEHDSRLKPARESLSLDEVATHLKISAVEVRSRQNRNSLFAFKSGTELWFPRWQFTGDPSRPVLPNLPRLVKAFRPDMHPASILGFMSTPQASARIAGISVTPAHWLLHGGDPQVLEDILDSFLQS
jgi:hypothetical protein